MSVKVVNGEEQASECKGRVESEVEYRSLAYASGWDRRSFIRKGSCELTVREVCLAICEGIASVRVARPESSKGVVQG